MAGIKQRLHGFRADAATEVLVQKLRTLAPWERESDLLRRLVWEEARRQGFVKHEGQD